MSSVGQAIGGVVGGVIGFFTGGPTGALYGAQIGMGVGGLIDPPKGPNINGPRLSDLSVQTSTYGAPIPRVYGTIATHGNVIWLEGDKLKEVAAKTKQGGKGGSSATTTTYSYYATFAVGLCKGPIAGVRRIWVGANLIYDAGGDDLESIIASNEAAQGFALYLGTEGQQPDPRMQADLGVADCPAYRGLAYIVFYDLALKDYGNSLQAAQVKVEVVEQLLGSDALEVYSEPEAAAEPWASYVFSRDPESFAAVTSATSGVATSIHHPWGRTSGKTPPDLDQLVVCRKFEAPYAASVKFINRTKVWIDGAEFLGDFSNGGSFGGSVRCCFDGEYLYTRTFNGLQKVSVLGEAARTTAQKYLDITMTEDGRLFGVVSTTSPMVVHEIDTDSLTPVRTITMSRSGGAISNDGVYVSCDRGVMYLAPPSGSNTLYGWDIETGALVRSCSVPLPGYGSSEGIPGVVRGNLLIRAHLAGVKRVVVYRICVANQPQKVHLAALIESESLQSGVLTPFDVDTSEIDQGVRGYRVAQVGAIRGALEPLQAAWPFDALQSGYKLAFRPRGASSVATIPADQLDARRAIDAPGTQLTIAREMDTQLPRRVVVRYLDTTREYDISEQAGERLNTDSMHLRDVELPIVLTATEAAGMAEVLLYLYWLERREVSFRLPPLYRYLEPADVITVTGEWGQYELRLVTVHLLSDGRIECQARYNAAALYTPTAQGEEGSSTPKPIALAGPSYYALLDIPLLRDEDDAPGFPAAMAGYTSGWPGGILFRSPDDGQTWTALQGFDGPATLGFARTALAAGRTDIIDASSVLQVDLLAGALESVSELAMLSGANYFALGADGRWEIIAARTCELQADGSYILRDFLRGRSGTEWAMSTHQAGDILVLLTDPDLAWIGMDAASIGLARDYRGITSGRTIDSDEDRAFTYRAVNLEPLSPVYLNGSRHPTTGDWSLSWIRRGRVSPSWRNSVDVPLGEASEAYDVEIYASSSYTTVKRTIAVTSASASYTNAQQVADFGANQGTLYLRIYQLSATVGRGYPLQTSITR